MPPKRHYNRWKSRELENLYKEYNLRELTVQEIAKIHKRSIFSILNKLQNENLIDSKWTNARGWKWDNSDFDNSDSENFINTENVVKPFIFYYNKNVLNNKYYWKSTYYHAALHIIMATSNIILYCGNIGPMHKTPLISYFYKK